MSSHSLRRDQTPSEPESADQSGLASSLGGTAGLGDQEGDLMTQTLQVSTAMQTMHLRPPERQ